MAEHWKAEENRNFRDADHMSGHIVTFNPTPEPVRNSDGRRSLSLIIPAFVITHFVSDPAKAAQDIADALNSADAKDKRIAEMEAQLAAHTPAPKEPEQLGIKLAVSVTPQDIIPHVWKTFAETLRSEIATIRVAAAYDAEVPLPAWDFRDDVLEVLDKMEAAIPAALLTPVDGPEALERFDYLSDAQARELWGTEDDDELPHGRVRVCAGEWVRIPGGYYFDGSAGFLHPETASEACDDCEVTIAATPAPNPSPAAKSEEAEAAGDYVRLPRDRARRHAVELEQCSIFAADVGDAIAKSMTDAAADLRAALASDPAPAGERASEIKAWLLGDPSTGQWIEVDGRRIEYSRGVGTPVIVLAEAFKVQRARADAAEQEMNIARFERDDARKSLETARQDAARLDWLEANPNADILQNGGFEGAPEWVIYLINGGRNDREWHELARGVTVRDAIDAARSASREGTRE